MLPFYIILGVLLVLLVAYLILIAPVRSREIKKYKKVLFAHRGLHGEGRAENSMSAFRAAIEAGYGIELDIRLSSDGQLVVHHDDELGRVAEGAGRVDSYTAEELSAKRLSGTEDGIPLFEDVLKLVDGRVPLLVEIKEDAGKYGVSDAAAKILKSYRGPYIVESFNPLSLGNIAKRLPEAPRGILAENYFTNPSRRSLLYFVLKLLLLNRICKPCFIAFNHQHPKSVSLRICRSLFGATTFAWTVRSPEEEAEARRNGFDSVIFENYIPEKG